MNHDDLEGLLSSAFDARARASVPDAAPAPAPRFAATADLAAPAPRAAAADPARATPTGGRHLARHAGRPTGAPRRRRVFAPLAAAAAVVVAVSVGAFALRSGSHPSAAGHDRDVLTVSSGPNVHVTLLNGDGDTYGVGMPVIAYFSRKITDARAFQRATTATVNGKPLAVDWYFEQSDSGNPIEAHLRPEGFWPGNATVHVSIAARGLAAGPGLAFDDSLTLDFHTGPRQLALVDATAHTLTLSTPHKTYGPYPVSLGAAKTPTSNGYKVIMDRQPSVCIDDATAHDGCPADDVQRLTYGGEYLLSAPWNTADIAHGVDSSQGSTDLQPAAAKVLYGLMRIGDVVQFEHTDGPPMTLGAGYGDWNVPWTQWLTGGKVPTR